MIEINVLDILQIIWGSQALYYLGLACKAVGIAAVVAKFTPTQADNRFIDSMLAVIDKLALNPKAGKARQ